MTDDELNALAHTIAYEAACTALECATLNVTDERGDFLILDTEDEALFADDQRYLEARGLLIRHPEKAGWFQIIDESQGTR